MKKLTFLIYFIFGISQAQNEYEGVVLDKNTKKPIEFVDVYNKYDFTATNEQGQFYFSSKSDSINFNILGYKPLKTTFKHLPKNDTIFLESKFFVLEEVVIGNEKQKLKKIKEAMILYPKEPYQEKFFLRSVLKQDNNIIKLEDIVGIVRRKALFTNLENEVPKKNYEVAIQQLRKIGIEEKGWKGIDFEMYSFSKFFTEMVKIFASPKDYTFEEVKLQDGKFSKLLFEPKKVSKYTKLKGYYIVNNEDNVIIEAFLTADLEEDFKKKFGVIKYRSTFISKKVNFIKSPISNKYHIDKARIDATVELFELKNNNKRRVYDVSHILKTSESFKNHHLNKKVSVKKDIFRLKGKYNADFWKTQHQLKLTDEMRKFIRKAKNIESKSFRSVNNME